MFAAACAGAAVLAATLASPSVAQLPTCADAASSPVTITPAGLTLPVNLATVTADNPEPPCSGVTSFPSDVFLCIGPFTDTRVDIAPCVSSTNNRYLVGVDRVASCADACGTSPTIIQNENCGRETSRCPTSFGPTVFIQPGVVEYLMVRLGRDEPDAGNGTISFSQCSNTACPNFCSFNGQCTCGTCTCDPGYSGVDCSVEPVPVSPLDQGGDTNAAPALALAGALPAAMLAAAGLT